MLFITIPAFYSGRKLIQILNSSVKKKGKDFITIIIFCQYNKALFGFRTLQHRKIKKGFQKSSEQKLTIKISRKFLCFIYQSFL